MDIVFIQKDADGATSTLELNDLEPELYELFVPMGEHVSSLFTNDDLEIAASKLPNGSAAVLFLWENLWVANLRKAIVDAGGHWWSAPRSRPKWSSSSCRHSPRTRRTHTMTGGSIMRRGPNPPGPVGGVGAGNPPGPVGGVGRGPNPPGPVGGVGRGPIPPARSAGWAVDRIPLARSAGWVGRRNGVGLLR